MISTPPLPDDLLDIQQAARLLQVSVTSLRRWTNAGELACVRVGGRRERRFRRADLLALLDGPAAAPTASRPPPPTAGHVEVAGVPVPYGRHLCSVYGSDVGRTRLAVGFIADGLREGSACVLMASPAAARQVTTQLARAGHDVRAAVDAGRLVVFDYLGTYAAHLDRLETAFARAVNRGARALRVVGNVSDSGLARRGPLAEVLAYEDGYDQLLAQRFPVVTLCQYDARRHTGLELLEVLKRHPHMFAYPRDRVMS